MVSDAGAGDLHQLWNAVWDPHDHSRLLTAGGSNIQVPPPPHPRAGAFQIEHAAICRMDVCMHMQAPHSASQHVLRFALVFYRPVHSGSKF